MLKTMIVKFSTIIFAICTIVSMLVISYKIGFKVKNETIYLGDLTGITYILMLLGIILGIIALAMILISTFFSRWISFDRILWASGLLILFIAIIISVSGAGYFFSGHEVKETISTTRIILILAPGLSAVVIGATWFIKPKKDNNLENEIEIKQLNRNFRLFLFIIFNWYITAMPCIIVFSIMAIISNVKNHNLMWQIITLFLVIFLPCCLQFFIFGQGIKYLPKDLHNHYLNKNNCQLEKIKNVEITNVTQFFNVIPICDEVYSKNEDFKNRTKREFKKISQIEISTNRLVINGKVNNLDFSWGIVTKMKKTNFKVFLLAILYFGPFAGIVFGFFPQWFVNSNPSQSTLLSPTFSYLMTKYRKIGGIDLFPYNVGRINSENYLIFAAKLQKRNNLMTLIPNNNRYQWPANLSERQKAELETLIATMPFSPSIYLYQDNISIVMKKYYYNAKDNNELQTWELLKQENSNNETHFNYLNNAIKIYQIFNETISDPA